MMATASWAKGEKLQSKATKAKRLSRAAGEEEEEEEEGSREKKKEMPIQVPETNADDEFADF